MTSLNASRLLPLSALLLLFITPMVTEVVQLMSKQCKGFLLQDRPPQIPGILENGLIKKKNQYKAICQTYKDTKSFVTLYDINNNIPVFSGYKYTGEESNIRNRPPWMIEPQLENMNNDRNMADSAKNSYQHQASDHDYTNNNDYNRGHLFPASYAFDINQKESTFTLTNIVPQARDFNSNSWGSMEQCVKPIMNNYCKNNNNQVEGYIVTGAQPSKDRNNNKLNGKINIPSVLWSAFCCYSEKKKQYIAGAHWGRNNAGCTSRALHLGVNKEIDLALEMKTLAELKQKFGIDAFPNTDCPLETTVADVYPKISIDKCLFQPKINSSPVASRNKPFPAFLSRSRTFCEMCQILLGGKIKGPQRIKELCKIPDCETLARVNIDANLEKDIVQLLNQVE